jgi:hypothetical protein
MDGFLTNRFHLQGKFDSGTVWQICLATGTNNATGAMSR